MNIVIKIITEIIYLFFDLLNAIRNLIKGTSKFPNSDNSSCIIIGNGPSLNLTYTKSLKKLMAYDAMVVNNFAITEHYTTIQPKFYIILDPRFFYSKKEMDTIESGVYERIQQTIDAIIQKTSWELKFFLPYSAKNKSCNINRLLENKNVVFFYYHSYSFQSILRNRFVSMNLGILGGMNVLHAGLVIGLQLNYKRIFLVGADHSWLENIKFDEEKKLLYLDDNHFYGSNRRYYKQMNMNLRHEMYTQYKCFADYYLISEFAKFKKAKILNASERSFIDAFEFAEL